MAALGLDSARQKALFKMRAKLVVRQFMREKGRLLYLVLALLFIVPVVLGLAVATGVGYFTLPEPWPAQLLGLVFVGLWVVWMTLPIFAFHVNEGLDMTRLLIYPLSRRDVVAAMLLGTLLDYPTYFMLPLFAAVVVGWGLGWTLPLVLLAIFLGYAQMVFTSQVVVTAAGGILRSRRFRDVFVFLSALLGFSCYFLQQGLVGLFSELVDGEQLLAWEPLNTLQWLPPGAAARAIERAASGSWAESVLWLGYAGLWVVVMGWAWWRLSQRLLTGEGFLLALPAGAKGKKQARERQRERQLPAWIPADLAALAQRELKLIWRSPQRRVALLQGFLLPLFMGGYTILDGGLPDTIPDWAGLALPFYAIFLIWVTNQNMLGWEGRGLATLLLTPVPRWRIFLAKGAVMGALNLFPLVVLGIAFFVFTGAWTAMAGLVTATGAGMVTLGVSSVASVLFPFPVQQEGLKMRSQKGGGCVPALANTFLVPSVAGTLALPALAPLGVAYWQEWPVVGLVGSFFALAYGLLLFVTGTRWAGRLLLQREAEVLVATRVRE